jgi:hypothetical protein
MLDLLVAQDAGAGSIVEAWEKALDGSKVVQEGGMNRVLQDVPYPDESLGLSAEKVTLIYRNIKGEAPS